MLDDYPKLKNFLQTDSIPKECMLYNWLKNSFGLVDLLERKLGSLEGILDAETEKAGSLRGEILSSGSQGHQFWEAFSEIELAGSLAEAGLTPKFDVKLPNRKDFDLEVSMCRPILFEIKTARQLGSKGEVLKFGYEKYFMQKLCSKGVSGVVIDNNLGPYYFGKEIITRKEIDQLLKLIDGDILSKKEGDRELIYHFQQSAGEFKRGNGSLSIRLLLDSPVKMGKTDFFRPNPGEKEIQCALTKIKGKLQEMDKKQILKYQQYHPLIGYFNIIARDSMSLFYKHNPEEITKNILPKLHQFNELSAFILTYRIGAGDQGDVLQRKLVCNQNPLVHLTDEEKSFINSLEGFEPFS